MRKNTLLRHQSLWPLSAFLLPFLFLPQVVHAEEPKPEDPKLEVVAEGELRLDGKITAVVGAGEWALETYSFTSPRGVTKDFEEPRSKSAKLAADAYIHPRGEKERVKLEEIKLGTRVAVIGKNGADGILLVREVILLEGFGRTKLIGVVTVNPVTANLVAQGRVVKESGQLARAASLFNQAVSAAQGYGDKVGEAFAYRDLAGTYAAMQQADKALEAYNRSAQISHGIDDESSEAAALNGVGIVHMQSGKIPEAIEALEKADRLGVTSDPRARVIILNNLARAYLSAKRDSEAISALQRLQPLEELTEQRDEATGSLLSIAELLAKSKPDQAREYLSKAETRIAEARDARSKAGLLALLGQIRFGLGEKEAARAKWEEAIALLNNAGEAKDAEALRQLIKKLEENGAAKTNGDKATNEDKAAGE